MLSILVIGSHKVTPKVKKEQIFYNGMLKKDKLPMKQAQMITLTENKTLVTVK
jgi:hypothetical protein